MESKLALVFGARHLRRIRKGSVALDGVSLTVNDVAGDDFTVLIIPHTLTVTTFGALARGNRVNLEVGLMARYAARLIEARQ
jgi:riboflavin synthase